MRVGSSSESLTRRLWQVAFRPFFTKTLIKRRNRNYNFYELLGVEQDCSKEQIREAYLRLAKKYHPDMNPNDSDGDEQFKMVSLAYETLSNDNNRSMYDAYMDIDPNMGDWDFETGEDKNSEKYKEREKARADEFEKEKFRQKAYSDFWEGAEKKQTFEDEFFKDFEKIFRTSHEIHKGVRGEDILLEISIPFIEAFTGVQKGIKLQRKETCKTCKGFKSQPGSRPSKCFKCNGTGLINSEKFNSKPCIECKGQGYLIRDPCKECNGVGNMIYDFTETFTVPKGIKSDSNLVFEKKGNIADTRDSQYGDLIIKIIVEPSAYFTRDDDNIIVTKDINLYEAMFGGEMTYQTLDGEKHKYIIKPGTQSTDKIVLKNKGMYNVDDNNKRGDFIVSFNIKIPKGSLLSIGDKDKLYKILEPL